MAHFPSYVRSATALGLGAIALLAVTTSRAEISPNSAGTLILHGTTQVALTDGGVICGELALDDCRDAIVRSEWSTPTDLHVLVAFPTGASPRLTGVTFAIEYEDDVAIDEAGVAAISSSPRPAGRRQGREPR